MTPLRAALQRFSKVPSTVLFTVVYAVLWVPAGWVSRLFADWLARRAPGATQWRSREDRLNDPRHLIEGF